MRPWIYWRRVSRPEWVLCENFRSDSGQLVNLSVGEFREEMLFEVVDVAVLSGFEGGDALVGDADVDRSGVGWFDASSDEFVGFELGHQARNSALAQRSLVAEFEHRHLAILGEHGEKQQNFEGMKAEIVFSLQGGVERANQIVAGAD